MIRHHSPCGLVALALVSVATPSEAAAPVTYTTYGARLEVVLPKLSKATGMRLSAAPEIAGRAVILRLDAAPRAEALKRIADVTYGKWIPVGDGLLLHLDTNRLAKLRAAEVEKRRAETHRLVMLHNQPIPAGKTYSGKPAHRALAALWPFIDERAVAALPYGSEIVYSNHPDPSQRALPQSVMEIIRAMIAEENANPERKNGPYPNGIVERPDRIVLHLHPAWILGFSVEASMRVLDAGGNEIYHAYSGSADQANLTAPAKPPRDIVHKPVRLKIGKTTREFLSTAHSPFSEALRKRLQDPLTYDPISFCGELMVAYASARNKQFVASPGDGIFRWLGGLPYLVTNESQFLFYGDLVDSGADGWIELRDSTDEPKPNGHSFTFSHGDRSQLAAAVKELKDTTFLDFPTYCAAERAGFDYVSKMPQALLYPRLTRAVAPQNGGIDGSSFNGEMFQAVVGLLRPEEVRDLVSGRAVTAGSNSPALQAAVAKYVLEPGVRAYAKRIKPDGSLTEPPILRFDFSEILSKEASPEVTITLETRQDDGIEAQGHAELGPEIFDLPKYVWLTPARARTGKVRLGKLTWYTLRFRVAPSWSIISAVQLAQIPDNAPLLLPSQLPKAIRAKIQALDKEGPPGE